MTTLRTSFSLTAKLWATIALIFSSLSLFSQNPNLYFPPKTGTTWQTTSPAILGFCPERIDSLYQFLEDKNTKSFLLLKDGKIVLEKYFGAFVQDSVWYWASAGKSLSAFLVGQAQEEGILDIHDKTSQYLGSGWTSEPPAKEELITIRHQLTMTNGLDDAVSDDNCTDPACLTYKADAGTRWAYHNAPYHLIHDVLEEASGVTLNQYTKTRLFDRTGMKGLWINHILYSKARDMARYGLLTLAKGVWDGDTLLHDQLYVYDMTHSSQNLNKSYGYLWWLNGQPSFMLPGLQLVFPFKLIPNAPDDMFSALGKNDQKIHVVPSKGWVVVRQGNDAGYTNAGGNSVPILFDNDLWLYLNQLECNPVATKDIIDNEPVVQVFPNPTQSVWQIESAELPQKIELFNGLGVRICMQENTRLVSAQDLPPGQYWMKVTVGGRTIIKPVQK
ncbi:MAG: serine hydrolase [Saprospiraceae bacterium]|nr:serine hydrolase [Saprospiraceae bacterium]